MLLLIMSLTGKQIKSEMTLFLEENGYAINIIYFRKKGYDHSICFHSYFGKKRNKVGLTFWIGDSYISFIINRRQVKTTKKLKSIASFLIESIILIENMLPKTINNFNDFYFIHEEYNTTGHNMFFYPVFFTIKYLTVKHNEHLDKKIKIINRISLNNKNANKLTLIVDDEEVLEKNVD